jgi:hypothetical protein
MLSSDTVVFPLVLTHGDAGLQPSCGEAMCLYFPIIGWLIGSKISDHREQLLRSEIGAQLAKRSCFPSDDWNRYAPDLSQLALRRYCDEIRAACEWPNSNFLPTDPVRYVVIGTEILEIVHAVFEGNPANYSKFVQENSIREIYKSDILALVHALSKCEGIKSGVVRNP